MPEEKKLDLKDVAIGISFDPKMQMVSLHINSSQVRNWDMVIALLEMAKLQAATARLGAMQQAAMEAHQNNQMINKVMRG